VRIVGALLGLAMHAIQALVFLALELRGLALFSVASVALFVAAMVLVRRGWARVAMVLCYLEVGSHAVALTFAIGLDAGYLTYFSLLVAAPLMVLDKKDRAILALFISGALVTAPVVFLLARGREPVYALAPATVGYLALMNVMGALVGILAVVLYFSAATQRAEAATERERQRSEELLKNVLPEPIAARLKDGSSTIADSFTSVTVLFADLVGFTALASRVESRELVEMLNDVFSRFDRLAVRAGLEKIKTIGDAYMVVGGLPEPRDDHVHAVAEMALAMRDELRSYAEESGVDLDLRIGIHTGPAVAGVIGERKLSYDLWGDTVNTASRMESQGEPGRIQISAAVRDALPAGFTTEERGTIEVRGKGPMETWFLERG
jgi:adenylate cyclase